MVPKVSLQDFLPILGDPQLKIGKIWYIPGFFTYFGRPTSENW